MQDPACSSKRVSVLQDPACSSKRVSDLQDTACSNKRNIYFDFTHLD
jgi:hypothetical protein